MRVCEGLLHALEGCEQAFGHQVEGLVALLAVLG
jgi:hypothetical protein